jgi:ornithine carbamoyltransferase
MRYGHCAATLSEGETAHGPAGGGLVGSVENITPTRTRTSFELAAKSLGADTTVVVRLLESLTDGELHGTLPT